VSREQAIARAAAYFDDGGYFLDLARRVAIPSTAQVEKHRPALYAYLEEEIGPTLAKMGYRWEVLENPVAGGGPFLVAERHEGDDLATVLTYGHGDVVRGLEGDWHEGLDPWHLTVVGDRWYGRGTADNKGQHSINIAALATVLEERGALGFNSRILLEMSEEIGSPGLAAFAEANAERLRADVLIGSDGPRLTPESPTIYMGTRGAINFELVVNLREGGHHSGNWGGLISNAGTRLANAIASIVGPKGEIKVPALKPESMPNSVRAALASCVVDGGEEGPEVEPDWGEPGLTPAERVFGWNTFEVLAFKAGNPERVVNAIPPAATAWCQIRFTVDRDPETFLPAIRAHLDEHGFTDVEVTQTSRDFWMNATRLLPDHPWVEWTVESIRRTMGEPPMVLPNLGGSLPNDVFAVTLGLPTIWVPHSYASCSQHAPNEHVLPQIMREGLTMMTGIFWDLGEGEIPASTPE
jgi:acetylornithine deacetylase/succinyl-diaminopimelate desuccinylase-like protein